MAKVIKLKTQKPPVASSSGSGKRAFSQNNKGSFKKKKETNYRKDNRNAGQKDNRFDNRHSKGGGASSGRDKDKKDSKGESSDFLSMLHAGGFSNEALASINESGLDISLAISAAKIQQPGRISECQKAWPVVTNDKKILSIVSEGYRLQFKSRPPPTPYHGVNPPSDEAVKAILDIEAAAVLTKGAAKIVNPSDNEVTSGYFARPKKTPPGAPLKWRPIVSLKFVNAYLRKISFRMTTVEQVRHWIRPGYWFASVDLTDAYYSIRLHKSAWRFVRFVWRGKTYEYRTLVFGLASSPRIFTKVLTSVVKFLRIKFGILIVGYIDDFFIQSETPALCRVHTEIVILVLHICGFEVNMAKSALTPSQQAVYIGFVFNSLKMTISLPEDKLIKIVSICSDILVRNSCSTDELRSLLGRLESIRPSVSTGGLHYRCLQQLLKPFQRGHWNGSRILPLSSGARQDLLWWKKLSQSTATAPLDRGSFTVDMSTDASGSYGWGGVSSRGSFAQGTWSNPELQWHINLQEMVAVERSLKELMLVGDYVNLAVDSRTTAAFINRQGGTRSKVLCSKAKQLWSLVLSLGGWVKAHWIPREENELADMLSKSNIMVWELLLSPWMADTLWRKWFTPVLDLFASRQCHLLPRYCSFLPDSMAVTRDCFSMSLWPNMCYAFPPVPLISMTLDKLLRDSVGTAILVVPLWPASLWWMKLQPMLLEPPLQLPACNTILTSPVGLRIPYLNPLVACLVSGRTSC